MYRAIWGWPIRSTRHLGVTIVGVVLIGILIGTALPDGGSNSDDPVPARDRESSITALEGDRDGQLRRADGSPIYSTPLRDPPPEALTVADAWVRAFLNAPDGITSQQWVDQLRPFTTEETLPSLGSVNPANVPDVELAGEMIPLTVNERSVRLEIATTGPVMQVLLVSTPTGWLVSDYELAS